MYNEVISREISDRKELKISLSKDIKCQKQEKE